jgi:hypothetical protein
MRVNSAGDGARLRRRGRDADYTEAKRLLVNINIRDRTKGPTRNPQTGAADDAEIGADAILSIVDRAWRRADRVASIEFRQRHDERWQEFRRGIADLERRALVVFDRFERRRRDLGTPNAARLAARGWSDRLRLAECHRPVKPLPAIVWEARIARALIDTLEEALGRQLRLGGPDIRLLTAIFSAVVADRRRRGLPVELARGKGARAPGSETWFNHVLRYRRKTPGPSS